MSEILPVGGFTPPLSLRLSDTTLAPPGRIEADPPSATTTAVSDSPLRFDEEMQRLLSRTSFRLARLRAVRADIEAGTYETRERIEGAVGRLIDVLR